jgi:pyridoxine 5-phosphate synthase
MSQSIPKPGPIALGVNIDHVATLRQARGTRYPSVIQAALLAEQAGADSITAHLREDRRHIQDRDIQLLQEVLQTRLNLEMAATDEMVRIACQVRPHSACLVPERREELTTEGGLNVAQYVPRMREICLRLAASGIVVSLFIEADREQIDAAVEIGAPAVELHTGRYADAQSDLHRDQILAGLSEMAFYADQCGLRVHAGHGLTCHNVGPVCRIGAIRELNIGHAIVADALFVGLSESVRRMRSAIDRATIDQSRSF